MKKLRLIILIVFILAAAFTVRIWRIDKSPPSVNWDEASLGYNAYSMLITGRDEFGKAMPVSLRSFDDYKPALYSYLAVPGIRLLGLSELSTRLVSVLAGTLLVFLVLYITAKTTGSLTAGVAAAIFTAVSPWAIHFSRIAFETNLATTLYYAGIALFVMALKQKKALVWSLVLMVLSMYAYHAQRAIAIPTLIILTLVFWADLKTNIMAGWLKYAGILALLLIPLGYSFLTEPAGSRLITTNILKLWPFAPKEFSLVIFNPVYSLVMQVAGQFLAYFSPVNIFLKGSTEPILRIPTLGLLPAELFPLWLAGLALMKNYKKFMKVTAVILFLAPLPGVITWNWFSVVRTVALYPAFGMAAAVGGIQIIKSVKKLKIPLVLLFAGVFSLSTLFTILTITLYAPLETFSDFQPGFEEMVPYVMEKSVKYNEVVVDTGQATPYIFFLFYGKYPPREYQREAKRDLNPNGNYGYRFGKFVFRKIEDYELYHKDVLLVGQTFRLKESEIENVRKDRPVIYKDFYDLGGYISLRVVEL